jgi:hypothetical protein
MPGLMKLLKRKELMEVPNKTQISWQEGRIKNFIIE